MLDISYILDRPSPEHQGIRPKSRNSARPRARLGMGLRVIAAVLFCVAAVNHAVLAARGQGVVWRHELFVGINLALAAGLVLRPRWVLLPLALLACQQIPSHGADFVRSLSEPAIDWPSLGVVFFFPVVLTLLVVERRRGKRGSPSRARPGS